MKQGFERIILAVSIVAYLFMIVSVLTCVTVKADSVPHGGGRLPGDDVPATERCYLTEAEAQEDFENERIEAALLARAHVLENCTITFYCNERYPHICGTGDGIAADGTQALAWATCAVDPDVIPLGSTVLVDLGDGYGLRTLVANATGVSGNHIDICVSGHAEAERLGRQTATVYWCEE